MSSRAVSEALGDISAVLLVGGSGTRLRPIVASVPKPLAAVGDRPFLELLVRQLHEQGIRRLLMCTGHMADQIENQFGDGRDFAVQIRYSRELQPLGTAGALKLASCHLGNAPEFLVMNGDSFLEMDFWPLIEFHRKHQGLASMAVRRVANAGRYGTVEVDAHNRVTSFVEKNGMPAAGLVNAGIYIFDRRVIDEIPEGKVSLEQEIIPRLLDRGVFALEQDGMFIDIGTPEDYRYAQVISAHLRRAAAKEA